jgi:hypothetical protein
LIFSYLYGWCVVSMSIDHRMSATAYLHTIILLLGGTWFLRCDKSMVYEPKTFSFRKSQLSLENSLKVMLLGSDLSLTEDVRLLVEYSGTLAEPATEKRKAAFFPWA